MYLRKYKTITIQLDTLFNFKQTLLVKFLSIDRLFFLKSEQKFKPIFFVSFGTILYSNPDCQYKWRILYWVYL
jgi:hypothetical protein